jgi:hypothetical protein
MNAPDLLEQRLRRGLQAAADALPPAEPSGRRPSVDGPRGARRRRRRLFEVTIGVAAAAAVLVGVVVVRQLDDGSEVETRPADTSTSTPSTAAPPTTAPGSATTTTTATPTTPFGPVGAGEAVIVGNEVRFYGPDGSPTGSRSLEPATNIRAASADGRGGWVVCGGTTGEGESTDQLIWFPAVETDPYQILPARSPVCDPGGVQVVDSSEGPVAVYQSGHSGPVDSPDDYASDSLRAIVVATGADRDTGIGHDTALTNLWTAGAGWVVLWDEQPTVGVYDLATGERLATAPQAINLFRSNAVRLAPDGLSLAAIIGGNMAEDVFLVVWELDTGAELFAQPLDIPTGAEMEGIQLAYDGTNVAYGNSSDAYPSIVVVDVATGTSHTVDDHGLLP